MSALKELFGVINFSGKVKTEKDELSSVWFEQTFKNASKNDVYAVFVKTSWDGGHSDGAKISAVTYNNISGQWILKSKQNKFTEIGSFGDAPENKEAELFEFTSDKPVLLIKDKFQQMGFEFHSKYLFLYLKNKWVNLGFIKTDENNAASSICGDDNNKCYSYKGKISVITSKKEYPDLLVTKTGTEIDNKGNIVPAKNAIYIFNGKNYE